MGEKSSPASEKVRRVVTSKDPEGVEFFQSLMEAYDEARMTPAQAQHANDLTGREKWIRDYLDEARNLRDTMVRRRPERPPTK
jgi:hypothetical protein